MGQADNSAHCPVTRIISINRRRSPGWRGGIRRENELIVRSGWIRAPHLQDRRWWSVVAIGPRTLLDSGLGEPSSATGLYVSNRGAAWAGARRRRQRVVARAVLTFRGLEPGD